MMLSPHFELDEFTVSETATRLGIDNDPPPIMMANLKRLAGAMEDVREILGAPILIKSGYRSPRLNSMVGGSTNSAHMHGLAADFICPGYGPPYDIAMRLLHAEELEYDQLIYEGKWVHFAIPRKGEPARKEALTAVFKRRLATYLTGIVQT